MQVLYIGKHDNTSSNQNAERQTLNENYSLYVNVLTDIIISLFHYFIISPLIRLKYITEF